jgi:hypothetical protein
MPVYLRKSSAFPQGDLKDSCGFAACGEAAKPRYNANGKAELFRK